MAKSPGDIIKKDPDAVSEPWVMDWTLLVDELDVTIASSDWIIDGPDSDLTVADSSIVTGAKKTQVRLSGGTAGADYTVTNRVVFTDGYGDDRSVVFRVNEK